MKTKTKMILLEKIRIKCSGNEGFAKQRMYVLSFLTISFIFVSSRKIILWKVVAGNENSKAASIVTTRLHLSNYPVIFRKVRSYFFLLLAAHVFFFLFYFFLFLFYLNLRNTRARASQREREREKYSRFLTKYLMIVEEA